MCTVKGPTVLNGAPVGLIVLALLVGAGCGEQEQPAQRPQMQGASSQSTTETALLAKDPYADPKGFFTIIAPEDWRKQEYPQDPRGKVAFIAPARQTDLRVLAKIVDISDYEGLIRDLKDIEGKLGVDTNIEPTAFNGTPAVKRVATITLQGVTQKFLWIDLLIDGVSHNLQYSAPPSTFDTHQAVAWKSMLTYHPIARSKPASPEEARRHAGAKWIRLAQIALEMGNTQAAREIVEAGLEADPQNAELGQMKANLQKR